MYYSEYLEDVFMPEQFKKTIEWVKNALSCFEFDTIAFRGTSGSAIAFPLSYELGIPLIHVRKHKGHSFSMIEGNVDCSRYVIIDDIVCTGETIQIIQQMIQNPEGFYKRRSIIPKCVGVIIYDLMSPTKSDMIKSKVKEFIPDVEVITNISSLPGRDVLYTKEIVELVIQRIKEHKHA